ncbi:MAG: Pentapeptide repeat protein [candidate division TM6 bacterium GW2011_GWF2_32_72]|nr:MAG: Pentapeptide repeat protein [candidate division TM6 bacterium GW2011_GWF2_32_72]
MRKFFYVFIFLFFVNLTNTSFKQDKRLSLVGVSIPGPQDFEYDSSVQNVKIFAQKDCVQEISKFRKQYETGEAASIREIVWAPSGDALVVQSPRGTRIWDPNDITGRRCSLAAFNRGAFSPVWSKSSRELATISGGRHVNLWRSDSGSCVKEICVQSGKVNCVAISPCERFIASGSENGSVRICDKDSGRMLFDLTGYQYAIKKILWSPCGGYLLSEDIKKKVIVWELNERKQIHGFGGQGNSFEDATWSFDGKYLAFIHNLKGISVFSLELNRVICEFDFKGRQVSVLSWSAQENSLIIGMVCGQIVRLDVVVKRYIPFENSHSAPVKRAIWSPCGRFILSVSSEILLEQGFNAMIILWDAKTGKSLWFKKCRMEMENIAWRPKEGICEFAYGNDKGWIRICKVDTSVLEQSHT